MCELRVRALVAVDIARATMRVTLSALPPADPMSVVLPSFTPHFATLAGDYDVVLCDVWGVVHNGVASSGDVTRALIAARAGARVFHIGPERDVALFEGLDTPTAPLEHAAYALCTGLNDDTVETPQDYSDVIARMRARSLPMICANPDEVVERGDKLIYCAGAIADLYAAAGGEVIYAGKPYRPIYEQALALAEAARGGPVQHHRLLAIGDSVRTDLKGAAAFGIDCLFVTAGIHAEELGNRHDPDAAALAGIFAAAGVAPKAVMHRLSW